MVFCCCCYLGLLFDCPCGHSPTPVIVISSYQSRLQLHVCQRGVAFKEREKREPPATLPFIHSGTIEKLKPLPIYSIVPPRLHLRGSLDLAASVVVVVVYLSTEFPFYYSYVIISLRFLFVPRFVLLFMYTYNAH